MNATRKDPTSVHAEELMKKPVCLMSGEELIALTQYANGGLPQTTTPSDQSKQVRVIGIKELAAYLGCCESTVYAIKKIGVLDPAIVSQIGKRIVFDAERARELADGYQKAQRELRDPRH